MSFLPSEPLVAADNIFAMGAVIVTLAWLGFWVDRTWLGRKTSGVIWVLLVAMALSNTKVLPFSSPTYDFVGAYLVPLSIPLLLFKANLRRVFIDGGPVLAAFALAVIGTTLGVVVGFFVLDLGELGHKAAGAYAGGWIGGAVNLVGVSKAVELTPDEFSIVIGASSGVSIIMLMTLVALPAIGVLRRFIPSKTIEDAKSAEGELIAEEAPIPFKLTHIAGALAASFAICALAYAAAEQLGWESYSILIVTALSILVANVLPKTFGALDGDFQLGMFAMYLFFASIGLGTNLFSFLEHAPVLFFYGLVILAVHMSVVLAGAAIFKIDLAQAIVGSGAALVGPAPTAAIASTQKWFGLVTPGIMCGILGYAIATFIGVALSGFLAAFQ